MLLAVCGKPISHSASPALHCAGMRSLGIDGASLRITADTAKEALQLARDLNVRGMNVTAPFKEDMAGLVAVKSEEVIKLRALNTVILEEDGTTSGFNTDVFGVCESLRPYLESRSIIGKRAKALIIGAGGAAKAAAEALTQLGVGFSVCNRSAGSGEELARMFRVPFSTFQDPELGNLVSSSTTLVNTLSVSERHFAYGLIRADHIVFDANYREKSEVLDEALSVGATVVPATEWLLRQSWESQKLFFGRAPDLQRLRESLRDREQEGKPIALIGMMGSGKTEVGKRLCTKADFNLQDVDALIETKSGRTINDIFSQSGEEAFRSLESDVLAELARKADSNTLVSCGGGIILSEANRAILREHFRVIWLYASPDTLCERLREASDRPLLKSDDSLLSRLQKLMAQRKSLYSGSSDLVICSEKKSLEEVAERIYEEVC